MLSQKPAAGETVLAACDSKNDVEKLKRSVKKRNKKIKVLTVTSETKAQKNVEVWIKNPNKESQRWDVVIYNLPWIPGFPSPQTIFSIRSDFSGE